MICRPYMHFSKQQSHNNTFVVEIKARHFYQNIIFSIKPLPLFI